ncbi:MAG: ABC transporter ATP-binding protein [Candidatus Kerfeldbacteria bacterium]|nr:ABC transporter ATP-binding protein [Candidatus Kerfeldbacteria bacterium]
MITIEHLTKTFGNGQGEVKAVDDISMTIAAGQLAAVVGKSGSGKSTLLALLGALDQPTSGTITVDDHDVSHLHGVELLRYRRNMVGFVFQNYQLVPNLNALENVMLPMEFSGLDRAKRRQRATHLLEQVGIGGELLKRTPGKLSGGEQQRVAIARSLANHPKLVLADEPTGNLDSQTSKTIIALLQHLAATSKTTILTVTHDQDIARLADVVFRLHDGRLTQVS